MQKFIKKKTKFIKNLKISEKLKKKILNLQKVKFSEKNFLQKRKFSKNLQKDKFALKSKFRKFSRIKN